MCSPTDELGGILVSCADFLDKMNHAEAAFTKLIESGLLLALRRKSNSKYYGIIMHEKTMKQIIRIDTMMVVTFSS